MIIRDIQFNDIDEVWKLLNQLSFEEVKKDDKITIWNNFNGIGIVVEYKGKIIGYGSIVLESKIRGRKSAQIEDLVIDENCREKGIGQLLVNELCKRANCLNAYRISLFCKKELITFYEKNGFKVNNVVMKKWLV
jgi:N-acetylglutamate synthase-like GNAT family acetyltransferase